MRLMLLTDGAVALVQTAEAGRKRRRSQLHDYTGCSASLMTTETQIRLTVMSMDQLKIAISLLARCVCPRCIGSMGRRMPQ